MNEQEALYYATHAAMQSTCQSKRGVVLWHREIGIISIGWNEPPLPWKCDGSDACKAICSKTAIHAEQAALIKAFGWNNDDFPLSACEMLHVKIVKNQAVYSDKPSCWQCSKLILFTGLKAMWLYHDDGLKSYTPEEFHKLTLENCNLTK